MFVDGVWSGGVGLEVSMMARECDCAAVERHEILGYA